MSEESFQDSKVTPEEVDLLLKSVREYTDALRQRFDVLESLKIQMLALFSFAFLATPLILLGLNNSTINDSLRNGQDILLPVSAGIFGALLGVATIAMYLSRITRAVKDVFRLSEMLEVIVRRASQLRDRNNFSFTQKIYIDVGLKEAESTLYQVHRGMRSVLLRLIVPRPYGIRFIE